ncbi:biotin/lipoyl-binding protein [Bradyrhizobium oligotrophicum S58]
MISGIPERAHLLGLVAAAALAITVTPTSIPPTARAANAQEERWLAVAPGRVEPASGLIKLGAPVVGLIQEVLVRPNETVFAGQALVRLGDAEARAQLASAEAQVAMRKRVRNKESTPSGPARDGGPKMAWPMRRRRCSTRVSRSTRPWPNGAPDAALMPTSRARGHS